MPIADTVLIDVAADIATVLTLATVRLTESLLGASTWP
jgi:hypothetical protein